jgi:hypothetical protein
MGLLLLAVLGLLVLIGQRFGGLNAWRALRYGRVAQFTRTGDAQRGLTRFQVTPARPAYAVLALAALPIPFGILFPPLWLFTLAFLGFALIGARHRVPAELTVGDGVLRAGDTTWPVQEIADIVTRKNSRAGEHEVGTVVTTNPLTGHVSGAKPTSALVGKALGGRMAERSWIVAVRSRSGSAETIIAGGLTGDVALALRADLMECVGAEREV